MRMCGETREECFHYDDSEAVRSAGCHHYGQAVNDCRILVLAGADVPASGPGWRRIDAGADPLAVAADVLLMPASSSAAAADAALLDRLALPLLLAVADGEAAPPALVDRADGFVLPGDDPATIATVAAAARAGGGWQVAEQSGTAQHISALSAEAQRIADALARLAAATDADTLTPVNAGLVRRLIRLRRDRDRHFPAELFADPAWDMLLDLAAARMEGGKVAVSSLCVAAAVPTTTALRWIRSLSQAGLFVRRTDPVDARRAFIDLSDTANDGVQAWLRRFLSAFQPR